jgi:hypothetical protein
MLSSRLFCRVAFLGLAVLAGFIIGCSNAYDRGGAGAIMKEEGNHIRQMNSLYNLYRVANNKPPPSPDALKEWAKKQAPDKLKDSVEDPAALDDVFVSPRDHEPYGIAPPPKGRYTMGPQRVVIYERTGVKGKHMVANGMGYSQEMDEKTLKEFVPNP